MTTAKTAVARRLANDPALAERVLALIEGTGAPKYLLAPEQVAQCVRPLLFGRGNEALAVVAVNKRLAVIGTEVLSVGSDGFTIVDPKTIFRWALLQGRSGASAIFMAHNHPSGDPTPSGQDREVTRRVAAAGRVVGIDLVDHLVVTDDKWTSLADLGDLPHWEGSLSHTG